MGVLPVRNSQEPYQWRGYGHRYDPICDCPWAKSDWRVPRSNWSVLHVHNTDITSSITIFNLFCCHHLCFLVSYFFWTIGQFWNVPFSVEDYVGDRGFLNPNYRAIIVTYRPGSDNSRQFVSLLEPRSWDRTKQPCLYSGNRQGGPIGDIDSDPNDSVIEGTYTDYIVNGLFESGCIYCSMFDNDQCQP